MIFLIIGILFLALLFPYGWGIYHQMRLVRRLKQRGAQYGFSLNPLHKKIWLPRNRSELYDFYIEGEQSVYLIKLWASYYRGRILMIGDDGRIAEQKRVFSPIHVKKTSETKILRRRGAWKSVPKTRPPRLKVNDKRVVPILLNYPTYDGIVRLNKEGEVLLNNGALLFEKQLFTPSALERYLFEEEVRISS